MAKILVERGLSVDRLREVLDYNPETGLLTAKIKRGRVAVGSIVGTKEAKGYIAIMIDSVMHKAHRLAWAHYYGEWPTAQVDHIYGIKNDNRISELRLATNKENCENQKLYSTNSSGFRGVSYYKNYNKWGANVIHNGERFYLGYFNTPEEAAAAAKAKREELFTHDLGRDAA